jgi:hypothetical protein
MELSVSTHSWDVDGSYDEKLGLFENLLWKPTSQAGKHALSIRCKEAAAALADGNAFGGVREICNYLQR